MPETTVVAALPNLSNTIAESPNVTQNSALREWWERANRQVAEQEKVIETIRQLPAMLPETSSSAGAHRCQRRANLETDTKSACWLASAIPAWSPVEPRLHRRHQNGGNETKENTRSRWWH
jgi:hypothetical protein